MTRQVRDMLAGLIFCFGIFAPPAAFGQEKAEAAQPPSTEAAEQMPVYSAYCENIADAAEEARASIRKKYLEDIEVRIEQRMKALDESRMVLEKWMKRREKFLAGATQNLIDIYSAMRPESAAQQISIMNEETAAAILLKLKPRTASSILNEIEPEKAAWLATIIAGAAKPPKKDDQS